jgi:CheY-like chemotaxis protein
LLETRAGIWFAKGLIGRRGGPARDCPELAGIMVMTANVHPAFSVLITDDDRDSRATLREIVEPAGFRTLLAENGEEALNIIQAETVHVALFDMHMPKMTGLEAMQLLRQFNELLPCILVTGDADEGLMRRALQAHVYSVIPKPVNKNVVLYTVVRALRSVYGQPPNPPTGR